IINVSSGGTPTLIGSNMTLNKDVTVQLSAGTLGHLTLTGNVTGSGAIIKTGGNILTLSGANAYGATTISAGTVQVGAGGTSGGLGNGNVTDNANLVFNRSDTLTVANNISGSGALFQAGTGTTQLNGSNSHMGGTTVSSGTLVVGNSDALGGGALTVTGGVA